MKPSLPWEGGTGYSEAAMKAPSVSRSSTPCWEAAKSSASPTLGPICATCSTSSATTGRTPAWTSCCRSRGSQRGPRHSRKHRPAGITETMRHRQRALE